MEGKGDRAKKTTFERKANTGWENLVSFAKVTAERGRASKERFRKRKVRGFLARVGRKNKKNGREVEKKKKAQGSRT